jgi:hypothetical protein
MPPQATAVLEGGGRRHWEEEVPWEGAETTS